MPKENEFLKQNQASQFVKQSIDVLDKKIGNNFLPIKIQVDTSNTLKNINTSLLLLNKSLIKINQPSLTNVTKVRSFVRRQDPNEGMRKNISDVEELLKQIRDNDEEERHRNKSGFLSGLGSILATGGLLGYFLTGKKEFLFNIIKNFTKSINLPNMLIKIPNMIKNSIKSSFKFVKSIGKSLLGLKVGNISKAFKRVKGTFKSIIGFTKSIGKIFAKGGLKGILSGVGKLVGKGAKVAVKKIPVIGALVGLMFGILRFKEGDWVGGLLEVASGVASIVPGVGTIISGVIDGVLLLRDFKGVETGEGSLNSKIGKYAPNMLRHLPGIGQIIRLKDAFELWNNGDKLGAMKEIGGVMAMFIPGGSLLFDAIPDIIKMFSNDKSFFDNVSNVTGTILNNVGGFFKDIIGGKSGNSGGDVFNDDNSIGYGTKTITALGKKAFGKIKSIFSMKQPTHNDVGFSPMKYINKVITNAKNIGIKLFNAWNPNYEGLEPSMKLNFSNMAKEYFANTGNEIQVNSAKREGGGKSVHDYGLAIDIDSNTANNLEKMGLLSKYGFHRPLLHWNVKNEPWHIEPFPGEDIYGERNTINNEFRRKILMNKNRDYNIPHQNGDIINLPQGKIEQKIDSNNPLIVTLTDENINAIAMAFGEQLKKNKAKELPISNSQFVSGRKF